MKQYKSKLTQAIKVQDHYIKEKEKEIAVLLQRKYDLEKQLESVDSKYQHFKEEMEEGRIVDSSYFFGVFDENIANSTKEQIKKLNLEIRYKTMEREKIKQKKEVLVGIDKKREAEFYYELKKKERKEAERTIAAIRELNKGVRKNNGDKT